MYYMEEKGGFCIFKSALSLELTEDRSPVFTLASSETPSAWSSVAAVATDIIQM